MEHINIDYSQIIGWGIDADPENDPTYPMKQHIEGEHDGYTWNRPTQQLSKIEVLHSIERNNMPAVFGTSLPPKGISGILRRFAFKFSEASYGHWLPLLVADRINVLEGIFFDITSGRFPNTFLEKGGKASWRFNRKKIVINISKVVLLASASLIFLFRKNIFSR